MFWPSRNRGHFSQLINSMEWLSNFAGYNGIPVLIAIILILFGISILAKKGVISFNGKGLRIGQDQATRNLIQAQFEYTKAKCEGAIAYLPDCLDIYHSKYIIARVEDVIQRAIIFNNMSTESSYIKSKQEMVYQTVMKRITNDYFKTPDFKEFCYSFTKDLIEDLVKMKELRDGK